MGFLVGLALASLDLVILFAALLCDTSTFDIYLHASLDSKGQSGQVLPDYLEMRSIFFFGPEILEFGSLVCNIVFRYLVCFSFLVLLPRVSCLLLARSEVVDDGDEVAQPRQSEVASRACQTSPQADLPALSSVRRFTTTPITLQCFSSTVP